ncbi:MAG: TolC family protein [Myxococcus sp.]|nr:TolC family protein [Myxococcus sp.]
MRGLPPIVGLTVLLLARVSDAQGADGMLSALVDDAIEARPELAQARAEVRAAQERVPQAESWPDPMLQVGVQNDSFNKWQVGTMETSWLLFMASQTIPFPGKPGLRGDVANVEVTIRRLAVERVRLTTIADVRRNYVALQLARARLDLLSRLSSLLTLAVEVAQSRYESGEGPQSDILRARLELGRLEQQRVVLQSDEQLQLEALNRLRGHPLDEKVAARPLAQLTFPPPPDEAEAARQILEASPEYLAAREGVNGAQRVRELSRRQYLPDLTVGAGVMVRGSLDPMWTVTLGLPLPVFAGTKQSRAVSEADATIDATGRSVETVEQLLRLRTAQRLSYWRALGKIWRSYQDSLLANAEATATATLTQYRIGKVPFASVLEATSATIALVDASYAVLVDAWKLAIAQDESSLAEVSVNGGGMGSAVPGAGGGGGMSGVRSASPSNMTSGAAGNSASGSTGM